MVPGIEGIDVRLRFVAAVLLVIAVIAGAFAVTRIESLRDGVLVLAGGLVLAAVVGVLALTRDRQRQAMPEVERYFRLAPEMVILAGFDGYWKRVNPTVGAVLGYTEREALARPFMEFVHPDDRAAIAVEAEHPNLFRAEEPPDLFGDRVEYVSFGGFLRDERRDALKRSLFPLAAASLGDVAPDAVHHALLVTGVTVHSIHL